MLFYYIADTHARLKSLQQMSELRRPDLLCIAGDIHNMDVHADYKKEDEQQKQIWYWMRDWAIGYSPILMCTGNHDDGQMGYLIEQPIPNVYLDFNDYGTQETLFTILQNDMFDDATATSANQIHLELAFSQLNGRQWIWLHHIPPAKTPLAINYEGIDYGSPFIARMIHKYQPDLVLSGHVHSAKEHYFRIGKSTCFNLGAHLPNLAKCDTQARTMQLQEGAVSW